MRNQQLSMAVVSEAGERSFEQKAPLDNNMVASFKFLHVTGTAKAKSFQLSLDIAEPPTPSVAPESTETVSGRVWATFDSAPVTIISKPSKKTAKTRNISSCILAGGPVSLFNRINSQTVRTKYMTIDHAQLCASNVAWSAFNVNVVRRTGTEPPTLGGCHVMRILNFPALTLYTLSWSSTTSHLWLWNYSFRYTLRYIYIPSHYPQGWEGPSLQWWRRSREPDAEDCSPACESRWVATLFVGSWTPSWHKCYTCSSCSWNVQSGRNSPTYVPNSTNSRWSKRRSANYIRWSWWLPLLDYCWHLWVFFQEIYNWVLNNPISQVPIHVLWRFRSE